MTTTAAVPPAPPRAPSPAPRGASKQGLFTVWQGLNLQQWGRLREKLAPVPRAHRMRRASVASLAYLNSWHEFLEEQFFGRRIDATSIEHDPLFVIGHWRSGTTLLHNLLTLDQNFTYPNLYQVMFPGHFLLTERLTSAVTAWALPKTRPMDNVPTGWTMSQEDEIALLIRTLVSPYMMLAYQGHPEKYQKFFDLTQVTPEELALWRREFLRFLQKLTVRSNRPIVLKSPSHTYRIPLLLELFPRARFVYIHRNPYAVIVSSLHLRRLLFTDNTLTEASFEGMEEDTLATYENCIRRYEETKSLIPPGQLHEMTFADLEADPLQEMQRMYEAISLPGWDAVEPAIRAQMSEHTQYRKNKFNLDEASRERYYNRLKFVFDLYDYPRVPEGT